jgi:hypothetical protein
VAPRRSLTRAVARRTLILERVGVWERALGDPGALTPITRIDISQAGGFGQTQLAAAEHGVAALGYRRQLSARCQAALDAALGRSSVSMRHGVTATAVRGGAAHATIETAGEGSDAIDAPVFARLAAVADGTGDADDLRRAAAPRLRAGRARREARVRAPHDGTAFERFTPDGPMALLPEHDGYGLVWTAKPARAQELLALPDREFLAQLARHFGARSGPIHARRRPPHVSSRDGICPRARARTMRRAGQCGADAASRRGTGIQSRFARRMGARLDRPRLSARATRRTTRCSADIRAVAAPIGWRVSRSRTDSFACSATIFRCCAGLAGWRSLCSTPFPPRKKRLRARCCSASAEIARRRASRGIQKACHSSRGAEEKKSRLASRTAFRGTVIIRSRRRNRLSVFSPHRA